MVLFSKKDREYGETFSAYYPLIYSMVSSKVGSLDDAEDITQNIFILYYRKMHEVADPRAWLMGTMRYEVLNYYRKKGKDHDSIDNLFSDPAHTFVNGFRETRMLIEEAIQSIEGERNRLIFDMVAVQKYTQKETAAALGLTVRQVRYRYEMVMEHIIRYLKKKGIDSIEDLL